MVPYIGSARDISLQFFGNRVEKLIPASSICVLNEDGDTGMTHRDRRLGCLLGQLIGDALGTRYEFEDADTVRALVADDTDRNGFLPILGGGPFGVVPGQVTDDSELAVGLLASLLEEGTYNRESVAQNYLRWLASRPFDVGNTTRNAFRNARNYTEIVENSRRHNNGSLSNGCLMRISPLGLGLVGDPDTLMEFAEEDCRMTNPADATVDAVRVFVLMISVLVETGDRDTALESAMREARTPVVRDLISASVLPATTVTLADGTRVRPDSHFMGYFGVALHNALHQLRTTRSFHESLVATVELGGDTDTNGCIAGALLGAYYGASALPTEWIASVRRCRNPRSSSYELVDTTTLNSLLNRVSGYT